MPKKRVLHSKKCLNPKFNKKCPVGHFYMLFLSGQGADKHVIIKYKYSGILPRKEHIRADLWGFYSQESNE